MNKSLDIKKLAQTALLSAVIVLMAFTPIGFLKAGIIEITFIPIPVTIGAILMGPKMAVYFGSLFGLVSFIQCFGFSAFGVALFAIDPLFTFLLCLIPRILMAVVVAFAYKMLKRNKSVSMAVASICGPVVNTFAFVVGLGFLFGNSEFIQGLMLAFQTTDFTSFALACFLVNGVVEAVVCGIASFAVVKVLSKIVK